MNRESGACRSQELPCWNSTTLKGLSTAVKMFSIATPFHAVFLVQHYDIQLPTVPPAGEVMKWSSWSSSSNHCYNLIPYTSNQPFFHLATKCLRHTILHCQWGGGAHMAPLIYDPPPSPAAHLQNIHHTPMCHGTLVQNCCPTHYPLIRNARKDA